MEHVDKLLPLLILGVLGGILVTLLRRGGCEKTQRGSPPPLDAAPAPVAVEKLAVIAAAPPARTAIAVPASAPRIKPKPVSPPVQTLAEQTPMESLREMLCDKHALAAAFMLREILDPPLSRRRHPPSASGTTAALNAESP